MRNTESVDHEEHRVCGSGGGCVDRQSEEPEGIIGTRTSEMDGRDAY